MTAFGLFMLSMLGIGQQLPAPVARSQMISRSDWGARPSKLVEHFSGPAPFVIIHHSYIPSACYSHQDCQQAMRSMQDFHQLERGWNDIGYSFAIGGDGMIYTGRGFNVIGAHAPKYNDKSVGICMIGDWRTELPPPQMLQAAKDLIAFGVARGYIHPEFKLLGHRQVRDTECPGGRLFNEISTWPHFSPKPNTTENEIALNIFKLINTNRCCYYILSRVFAKQKFAIILRLSRS